MDPCHDLTLSLSLLLSLSLSLYTTVSQLKAMLVVHLVSLAFTTAALGLLSKNLPYRQTSYHCEHCRRLEIFTVVSEEDPIRVRHGIWSFLESISELCCDDKDIMG